MKYQASRRFGALALALSLVLSLMAVPAWAVDGEDEFSVTITAEPGNTLTVGDSVTLTANVNNQPADTTLKYEWDSTISSGMTIAGGGANPQNGTYQTSGKAAGTATFTVKVTAVGADGETVATADGGPFTVTWEAAGPVPATGISLDKTELTLTAGQSGTLTPTLEPANAVGTVSWQSDAPSVATVDQSGRVTAVSKGTAVITAGANYHYAHCTVHVNAPDATGITFVNSSRLVRGKDDPAIWDLSVSLTPPGAELPAGDSVEWRVTSQDGAGADKLPTYTVPSGSNGTTIRVATVAPGEFTFSARHLRAGAPVGGWVTKDVTISGITLTREEISNMLVGESRTIAVDKMYGSAASGSVHDVVWTSSDSSVVTVINGELVAWKMGSVVITANKDGYTAECKVTVGEDEESVISGSGVTATVGTPLILGTLSRRLDDISRQKTRTDVDANGNPIGGSPLNFITNVAVSTNQGTLYYNYNSEANTGAGVGASDCFGQVAGGTILSLDKLYFVPRQGFTGTAEISFTGWAKNGTGFPGVIRVNVTGARYVSYRINVGEPAHFLNSDFNTVCRTQTGRDLSYVTFNLPQASQGMLYHNYTGAGQPADRVSTTTQYGRSGRYLIDDVCFVPNNALVGEARISYRGVDVSGETFIGEVIVNVVPANAGGETANIYISAPRGGLVTLQANLFNDACQATIRDTLSHVSFRLPAYDEGTLYYNYRDANHYDSRVASATRYYYSGVPGINGITFVPASNSTGRVAIQYTGHSVGGTSFTGTIYISTGGVDRTTIRYFVPKNGAVNFDVNDFNTAALYQLGVSVEYVEFRLSEDFSLGTLYYDYVNSTIYGIPYDSHPYYRAAEEDYQLQLDKISFRAGALVGAVAIPYKAYTAADSVTGERKSFTGNVVIRIGSPSPADINLSGSLSGQIWLSSYDLGSVCNTVMNKDLSYIEITSLPPAEAGRVYSGSVGFKTGAEVKKGDRFYCLGSPNIDQLSFIPRCGFAGKVEITYIGFSGDGQEQVSGRIVLSITKSTHSRYFNDMENHVWAIDAVDYLFQKGAVDGVGGGRFNPRGHISKGDFTLLLVRNYGFTASGTVSYSDVPAGSYYAEAISIASQLGIASGSNGRYNPDEALSRQDAMVMLRNALAADGRTLTNGLAADLSIFCDEAEIDSSAREALGSLVQMGIVQGDGDGYLRPRSLLNRAETAKLMHAVMTL